MFETKPLGYTHRDKLSRVIRLGDYVVWANGKQGNGLVVCIVQGGSPEKIRLERLDNGKMTNARPENMVVISAQVIRNYEGN
ncbi:MAG: hypothetical protein ACRDC4_09905, partial [Plesiomonas sp.]